MLPAHKREPYPDKNTLFKHLWLTPPMTNQEVVQVAWRFGLPPDDVTEVIRFANFLVVRRAFGEQETL